MSLLRITSPGCRHPSQDLPAGEFCEVVGIFCGSLSDGSMFVGESAAEDPRPLNWPEIFIPLHSAPPRLATTPVKSPPTWTEAARPAKTSDLFAGGAAPAGRWCSTPNSAVRRQISCNYAQNQRQRATGSAGRHPRPTPETGFVKQTSPSTKTASAAEDETMQDRNTNHAAPWLARAATWQRVPPGVECA